MVATILRFSLIITVLWCNLGMAIKPTLYNYILYLNAPEEVKKLASIQCLYHGTMFPCTGGQYIMQDREFRPFFSLIITPQVTMEEEGTNVFLTRVPQVPCKWYNIALTTDMDKSKTLYSWTIEEVGESDMPMRLPEHSAIVIQLPPDFIEKIESKTYTGCCVYHLPTIFLKSSLTQKQIDTATAECALGTLDLRLHHSYQRRNVVASPCGLISTCDTLCP